MILSGQVSPDGKLFAFTNTGYTHHALHIIDLATEKEVATFQMEQAWSGLAFSPKGDRIYVSNGAGYKQAISRFRSVGAPVSGRGSAAQRRYRRMLAGRKRASATPCTAQSRIRLRWRGCTSPDGVLLRAEQLRSAASFSRRAAGARSHGCALAIIRFRRGSRRTARHCTSRISDPRTSRLSTSANRPVQRLPQPLPPIRIRTTSR